MKKSMIFAITAMMPVFASAQVREGDSLFTHWNFFYAAQKYENEATKNPSPELYYKLGQCYQQMNRYRQAVSDYDKVNAMGIYPDAKFYMDYGLVLKTNERYPDAKRAFKTYDSLNPSDPRGRFYMNSCDIAAEDLSSALPVEFAAIPSLSSHDSTAADYGPVFYNNGLVFASSRETKENASDIYGWDGEHYLNLFYARTGASDTDFENSAAFPGTRHDVQDGPACFSKNNDTMYFNTTDQETRREMRKFHIIRNKIYSVVNTKGEWYSWGELTPFKYNSDSFDVGTPYLTEDGTRLFFTSNMPGGYGGYDLYYCVKQGNDWGPPVNMGPNINTPGDEKFPSMDASGNFYFASDGYKGYGGLDICVSKMNNGTFGQASVLKAPINSAGDDFGIAVSGGGTKGYVSSNRNTDNGHESIYYFNFGNLPCPVSVSDYVVGFKCPEQQKPLATLDTLPLNITVSTNVQAAPMVIYYDFDKYNIRPDARGTLNIIATKMQNDTSLILRINSYCDSRGSYEYNQVLSEHRASAVVNYLADKGIDKKRMVPRGYGKTHLISLCTEGVSCTDAQYQEDRRSEMKFYPPNHEVASSDK